MNTTTTAPPNIEVAGPLSGILSQITPQTIISIALFIVIAILIRYVLAWFITTLMRRGLISVGTKMIMSRIIDIIVIVTVSLILIHIVTASLAPYVIMTVLGLLVLIMFYYEIREFTAFITIQMQRYARGTWIEVYLPGHTTPVTGRLVDVQPFNSILEDVYGNKIYMANSVLVNSLIKEYNPSVILQLTVNTSTPTGEQLRLSAMFDTVRESVENSPFRFDETYTLIKSMSMGKVSILIRLVPLTTPVRASDLYKIMNQVTMNLKEFDPKIEVLTL